MEATQERLTDQFGRVIDYVRISITNHCNLNCIYCKPASECFMKPAASECRSTNRIMTKDEILRLAHCFTLLGVTKFKITGGEPLLRKDCAKIIGQIKAMPFVTSVTLTTNGTRLQPVIWDLVRAGISSINISLDTMDQSQYQEITGADDLKEVLRAIHACVEAGIRTKINCVILPGVNDQQLMQIAALAKDMPVAVRFIECMPIGSLLVKKQNRKNQNTDSGMKLLMNQLRTDGWKQLQSLSSTGPAVYYENNSCQGTVGLIAPMTQPFCCSCNRVRVESEGKLRLCLGEPSEYDLISLLNETVPDQVICERLKQLIYQKPKHHQFNQETSGLQGVCMQNIGG